MRAYRLHEPLVGQSNYLGLRLELKSWLLELTFWCFFFFGWRNSTFLVRILVLGRSPKYTIRVLYFMMGRYWTNWLASMVELTTRWRKCTKTFDVRSSLPWVTASTWWVRARGRQAAQWNVNAAVAAASVPRMGTAATVQTATQDGARLTFSGDSAWPQTPPRQTHVRFRFNLIVKRFWRNYDKTDTTEAISRMSHCDSCTNKRKNLFWVRRCATPRYTD